MVDQTPTLDSILSNFDPGRIEITYYDWPERWELSLFDVGVSINVEGIIYKGRGIDSVEYLALEKACSEALERCLVKRLKIPLSYSTAVHTSEDAARTAAYCEAFERDSFLVPFLLRQRPNILERERFHHLLPSKVILPGVEFELLQLPVFDVNLYSFCLVAKGAGAPKPFGVIVGLGCSGECLQAIKKSANECLARLASVIHLEENDSELKAELVDVIGDETLTNEIHFKQALSLNYVPEFFFSKCSPSLPFDEIEKKRSGFQIQNSIENCFEIQDRIGLGSNFSGIFFAAYKNPLLQPLFRGIANSNFLNLGRLNLRKEELCMIENQIHPLG
jgi:hypothetical protein